MPASTLKPIEKQIQTATFSEISVKGQHGDWARLLWQEHGRVILISDYGNWSYYWSHRGEATVARFLSGLDMHYMGKKMLGGSFCEHSDESTIQTIREHVIQSRKDGSMTGEAARREMDLVEQYAAGEMDFREWLPQSSITDAYEMSRREPRSEWVNFWERLWVPMIQPVLSECV